MTHTMSDHQFYAILIGWVCFAAVLCVGLWLQVRNADRKQAAEEARQIEADAEWDEWISEMAEKNKKGAVYDLGRGKEKDYQARARRAEGLGLKDPDDGGWAA